MISNEWSRRVGVAFLAATGTQSVIEENPHERENNDLKRPIAAPTCSRPGAAAGVAAALPAGPAQAAQPWRSPAEAVRMRGAHFRQRPHSQMDDDNSVVNSVAIRDGRFVAGRQRRQPRRGRTLSTCTGRTVVAGPDREPHALRQPRQSSRLSRRAVGACHRTWPKSLALLAARRGERAPGQFITCHGRRHPRMFAELRLPFSR